MKLDTPFHRLGALVVGAGAVALLVGVVVYVSSRYRPSFDDLFFDSYGWRDWDSSLSRIGVFLLITGWAFLYHFDKTVGRIWKWIISGA